MEEVWKDVKGYEGLYKVSNLGQIYSYPRKGTKGGYTYGSEDVSGHLKIGLWKNKVCEVKGVHCVVYEAFVGKILKGYHIHHKNHNPKDNRVENLELLSPSEHIKGHIKEHIDKFVKGHTKKYSKAVIQYTLDGDFISEYPSIAECERQTGVPTSNICNCCKGKIKTAGGYKWKYKEVA